MSGNGIPFKAGDFVWSMFPFEDDPKHPGVSRHAAIVMGAFTMRQAAPLQLTGPATHGLVVAVYTSSQIGKWGRQVPVGVIEVDQKRAEQLGQKKAFFIDVRKRAFLPYTREFFPDMDDVNHGIFSKADKALLEQIRKKYESVNFRYQEQIVNLGPFRFR